MSERGLEIGERDTNGSVPRTFASEAFGSEADILESCARLKASMGERVVR
jgi:hypothetical protein